MDVNERNGESLEPVTDQETRTESNSGYYQDNTASFVQPQVQSYAEYSYSVQGAQQQSTNVLAIVSLVLGIFSIVLGCCTAWVGCLFGIGGIVCAVLSRKSGKSGMATAGLVCSIIGIIIGLIVTAFSLLLGLAIADELRYYS